jgi:colanic acid/amylovoran biosynthesis glycosyltransferase
LRPPAEVPDLRVLVLGLGLRPEPFVMRTLDALAESGMHISVAGRRPTSLAASSLVAWRGDRRSPARDLVTRARATRRGAQGRRSRRRLPSSALAGEFDLVYVPWINAAVEQPEIFDLGAPVVVSCRGSFVAVAPWNPRRVIFRDGLAEVFRRAAAVHCVSHSMQREAEPLGLAPERATVVYTGVDTTIFRPDPDPPGRGADHREELRILWVGGLDWKKDVEHALLAVAGLKRSGQRCALSIVGSGVEFDRACFTRDDLGLESTVRFVGQVDQSLLPGLHRSHDVLLHSASTEGVPNAVVEAMASGLPVVATTAGGTGEAVTDGVEGFLVPVRAHEAMTERLAALAEDPVLRREMGSAGRRRALGQFELAGHTLAFRALLERAVRGASDSDREVVGDG